MKATIAVIAGDGIGPEVVAEGVRVLERVAAKFGHEFAMREAPFGGAAIDLTGDPLPKDTLDTCLAADAVLLASGRVLAASPSEIRKWLRTKIVIVGGMWHDNPHTTDAQIVDSLRAATQG